LKIKRFGLSNNSVIELLVLLVSQNGNSRNLFILIKKYVSFEISDVFENIIFDATFLSIIIVVQIVDIIEIKIV